jgi:RimJ/RimL family protein N-acetyltransferase
MKLADPDLGALLHICRNLRDGDREEIFATRWDDNPDYLAMEALRRWGKFHFVGYADDGEPVASIGASMVWPGVWTPWMMATERFPEIGRDLTKAALRSIIPAVIAAGCHRGEARSLATHHEAHRWMERLGAKPETVLRQYGRNRQDFILYVWEP